MGDHAPGPNEEEHELKRREPLGPCFDPEKHRGETVEHPHHERREKPEGHEVSEREERREVEILEKERAPPDEGGRGDDQRADAAKDEDLLGLGKASKPEGH